MASIIACVSMSSASQPDRFGFLYFDLNKLHGENSICHYFRLAWKTKITILAIFVFPQS